jgi:hypothetical protein
MFLEWKGAGFFVVDQEVVDIAVYEHNDKGFSLLRDLEKFIDSRNQEISILDKKKYMRIRIFEFFLKGGLEQFSRLSRLPWAAQVVGNLTGAAQLRGDYFQVFVVTGAFFHGLKECVYGDSHTTSGAPNGRQLLDSKKIAEWISTFFRIHDQKLCRITAPFVKSFPAGHGISDWIERMGISEYVSG